MSAPPRPTSTTLLNSQLTIDGNLYTDGVGIERRSTRRNSQLLGHKTPPRSAHIHLVRALALLCACSLSVGSHYATYILGPLKTRLSKEMGTSNTEFSLLLAAFSLNSTWTPLLGGFLAGRLGTTVTSIIATGLIFLGQSILLFGDILESVRVMTLGMFIFGLGVSPLAVVQESIIVRFFKNHGLGLSMAFGLVVGKASSFISARTSYPLSEKFGPRAPFYVAAFVTALSFIMNLVYLMASKWLVYSSGTELEASELRQEARELQDVSMSDAQALKHVAEKKAVHIKDITKLGDVFWAYIGLNVLCGAIWHPFIQLAPNIFEKRYDLTELDASNKASFLLAGSVFLYPICGYIIDRLRRRPVLLQLFLLSSVMTMSCYFWLALPPSFTTSPSFGVALYAFGQGFAPLLLVIIVPNLVSASYVPTTLGAHKSLEQTGTTIFQTFAGIFLDRSKTDGAQGDINEQRKAIQQLLYVFLFINMCQFFGIIFLWHLDKKRKHQAAAVAQLEAIAVQSPSEEILFEAEAPESPRRERATSLSSKARERQMRGSLSMGRRESLASEHSTIARIDEAVGGSLRGSSHIMEEDDDEEEEERPLLDGESAALPVASGPAVGEALTRAEHVRGEVFGVIGICCIAFAWVFFLWTAFLRLRSRRDRQAG